MNNDNATTKTVTFGLADLIAKGHHDGLCEVCDCRIQLPAVEGELGWYCSDKCLSDAEDSDDMSESELRRCERRQLGM